MQGRIYDPRLGRFAQADPFVQDSKDTQAADNICILTHDRASQRI